VEQIDRFQIVFQIDHQDLTKQCRSWAWSNPLWPRGDFERFVGNTDFNADVRSNSSFAVCCAVRVGDRTCRPVPAPLRAAGGQWTPKEMHRRVSANTRPFRTLPEMCNSWRSEPPLEACYPRGCTPHQRCDAAGVGI
jgi:hypothetical protein